jgi:hypothetical protein
VQLGAFTLEAPVSKTMIGRRAYARQPQGRAGFICEQAGSPHWNIWIHEMPSNRHGLLHLGMHRGHP